MKKIVITNGLIAGAIVATMMLTSMYLMEKGLLGHSEILGYSTMVIALSMIFFGIRTYRDQHLNGSITFAQGLKLGLLITLIGCLIYATAWEIYYNLAAQDFMAQYSAAMLEQMKASGASEAEIAASKAEMEMYSELYKNFFFRFFFTAFVEMFPVGLVISLISAALLRRREILPA